MKQLAILLFFSATVWSCQIAEEPAQKDLKEEISAVLNNQIMQLWYPRVVDSLYGGYLSGFDYRWKQNDRQNKMIVTQSRHVWTAAKAAEFYADEPIYRRVAAHGADFLANTMWDKTYGGFYNLVTRQGRPIPDGNAGRLIKLAYGNAFAIYGLAAYYGMSGDTAALNLATQGFEWLETHSHDPVHGGYFQFMERDGSPIRQGMGNTPPKDQNSSIHLMEAFTELYKVWKNPLLRERLEEMLILIRDTMTNDKGYLHLFFSETWAPCSYRDSSEEVRKNNVNLDHVSFGHDIETAWLLMDASEVLGGFEEDKTLAMAKRMVDHGLRNGWDDKLGGVYDGGYYFSGNDSLVLIMEGKNWWAQVETLNTLLYMALRFPNDEMDYYGKFVQQWNYIRDYLVDFEHGGFYAGGLDREPERKTGDKSHIWKGAYHTARGLMNSLGMLEGQ